MTNPRPWTGNKPDAVMLALIVVVCIAAITTLGSNANSTFSVIGNATKPTFGN